MTGVCVFILLLTLLLSIGYVVSQDAEREDFSFATESPVVVAHVSDLHYPVSFLSPEETAALVEEANPDIVVFTGDVFDASAKECDVTALEPFFQRLSQSFPCFGVIGNHEIGSEHLEVYLATAKRAGVTLLMNEVVVRTIKGREIAFFGLSDGYPFEKETFGILPDLRNKTKILLSHRPERFEEYANSAIRPDYVFAGHAHGGVARMGKLALYAPNQGLFPKYTSGLYEKNGVRMIVSRGLGISSVDFRCFNKYHLPVVSL